MLDNIPVEIIDSTKELYASGGGVKNPAIMKEIQGVSAAYQSNDIC